MKTTPLTEIHKELSAKLVEFAGYSMPVSYGTIKDEYEAVRNKSGIFDITHMAPILIHGEQNAVVDFINKLTCKDISPLKPGDVQYNALINAQGGVIDDITVYSISAKKYGIIANASNRENVMAALNEHAQNSQVRVEEVKDYVLTALQGPEAESVLKKCFAEAGYNVPEIYYYECGELEVASAPADFTCLLSRTGYTGEDGFEILLPEKEGQAMWRALTAAGATPSGLAARDLLRLEMFYPLYGNELKADWSPYEGGIGWLVSAEKDFIAKDLVLAKKKGFEGKVRPFLMLEAGVPRKDYKVFDGDTEIGLVTSGAFSFGWGKGFGMAWVKKGFTKSGTKLAVEIRGQKKEIEIISKSPHQGSIKRRPGG